MTTLTSASGSAPISGAGGVWPAPSRRPAAAAAGWSFTAADVLRAVRSRLILVLFIWLLVIGATIGATALWIKYDPEYRATAYVKVESLDAGDPMDEQRRGGKTPAELEMLVKDQAVVVTSTDVLGDVLQEPDVKNTVWYRDMMAKQKDDPSIDPVTELNNILSVAPIPNTSFLQVQVSGQVPSDLPFIANTVVAKYIDKVNSSQKTRYRADLDRLTKETDDARKLLETQNDNLDKLRSQLPASMMTAGGINPIAEKMATLEGLRTELEMAKLGRKQTYESLREMKPEELPITADMQASINADPILLDLRTRLDSAKGYLDQLLSRYGPNHREAKNAAMTIQTLTDRLNSATMDRMSEFRNQMLQTAQNDYYQAQEQEQRVAEQKEQVEAQQRDLDSKYARYIRELEERERLNEAYRGYLAQRDYLNMLLRREKAVRITQAQTAKAPTKRHSPQWILNVPVGIAVGLMLAVGLAVLLEVMDTSVRTPRDLSRHVGLSVLSSIPNVDDEEMEIGRIEMASIEAPHSIIAETFRQLRTNLFFSAPVEHQGVLLITSNGANDGKTTIAVNLAAAVAMSGRRVLLIDANFRRPGLKKLFPSLKDTGLSNVLIGQSKLSDVIVASEVPGLDLVGSGPTPPNPAELLGSGYLRDLIADARSRYDQVIFDGPPALLVSDALVLAGAVDGVVLVCRFRNTSRGALIRAKSQLDAINARVLGAVLNAIQTTRGGYFRKHYRAFYDYKPEEDEGDEAPKRRLPDKDEAEEVKKIGDQLEAMDPNPASHDENEIADQIARENQKSARGDRDDDKG